MILAAVVLARVADTLTVIATTGYFEFVAEFAAGSADSLHELFSQSLHIQRPLPD